MAWLFDAGPANFRLDLFLRAHPVILAHRVVEYLNADVQAARTAWVTPNDWAQAALPPEAYAPVIVMLRREGPALAARLLAAEQVRDALTGRRWIPRL